MRERKRRGRRKGEMKERKEKRGIGIASTSIYLQSNLYIYIYIAVDMSSPFPKVFKVVLSLNIMPSARVEGCTIETVVKSKQTAVVYDTPV